MFDANTILGGLAGLLAILMTVDKIAHTLGLTRVLSNALRDQAKKPGNALAPVEEQIAAHLDAGDDEAALSLVKGALGAFNKSKAIASAK